MQRSDSQSDALINGEPARVDATALVRCVVVVFLSLVMLTQSGCQIFRRAGTSSAPIPLRQQIQLPSQQQLLAALKSRSDSVRQLNSRVTVSLPGAPKIKGTLQVEFPDRMRMKAGVMGASELGVDVGSNAQEFWIWSKAHLPGQPPAFYHANHLAFARSPIRKSIPLEPKWLIEAIGLPHFSPTDVHYGPTQTPDGRMKLFTVHRTAGGRQTRATLLAGGTGLVEQQAIYDANNRLIAYTNSTDYKIYPDENLSLPQKVELNVLQPDGQMMKIKIDMGTFSINSLYGDPNKMWAKPTPPGGVRNIDLTQVSNQARPTNQPRPQYQQQQGSGYQPRYQPATPRYQPAAQSSGSGLR